MAGRRATAAIWNFQDFVSMQETITIVGDTVYSLLSALSLESKSDSDSESAEMSMKIGRIDGRMWRLRYSP